MLRRLKKALLSLTALTAFIVAFMIVVNVVEKSTRNEAVPSSTEIGIYSLRSDSGDRIECHRDNSVFTISTDDEGAFLKPQPISSRAEMQQCIEAYKSGQLPFDPRNHIGYYEAWFLSWEGFDHENIYHWGVPDECAPHYQFKQKNHSRLVDAMGLVNTIEVTFTWTGTDAEWETCLVAREIEIADIDLSELDVEITENPQN